MNKIFWSMPPTIRRTLYALRYPLRFHRLQRLRVGKDENGATLAPFDKQRCIFVHVPKCAGKAIAESLWQCDVDVPGAVTLRDHAIIFSKSDFESYFKFAFVRNPWDRVYSAYCFLCKGGLNDEDQSFADRTVNRYPDFRSFVKEWLTPVNIYDGIHFYPQYEFLLVPPDDIPKCDFIGRFENLSEDYVKVCKRLGIKRPLLHLNSSRRDNEDFRRAYDESTADIVGNTYQKDISLFGYSWV